MELSWSTFILEIVNFFVLVWILQRFLYRPVLRVIAERRESIEKELATARETETQAAAMKARYEGRLADWESERARARATLNAELDEERARKLADAKAILAQEKEKAAVAQDRQRAERQRAIEHDALRQAASFASRLLGQACGPELEQRLVTMSIDAFDELDDAATAALRQQWGAAPERIRVGSAFDLPEAQRRVLEQRLRQLSGLDVAVSFERDDTLLAGLRVEIGAWVLMANVRDDLASFADFAHAPR